MPDVAAYKAAMKDLHGDNMGLWHEALRRDQKRRKAEAAAKVVFGPRKQALHRAAIDAHYAAGEAIYPLYLAYHTEEGKRLREIAEQAQRDFLACPNAD